MFLQRELSGKRLEMFGDNEGAKVTADNPSSASKSKLIDVNLRFIRGFIRTGGVRILHVVTDEQHAGVLMKALWRNKILVQRTALMKLLDVMFRRVFCFHLVSSYLEHFRSGIMRSNIQF